MAETIHLLQKHPDPGPEEYPAELPRCPVCGAKAFIHKDIVDGFYMGWSVGCPRYCLFDGIHGHDDFDTPSEKWYAGHGFPDKKSAVKWWNRRVADHGQD